MPEQVTPQTEIQANISQEMDFHADVHDKVPDLEAVFEAAESRKLIGAFAVASSHLVEGRGVDDIPEYRSYKIPEFHSETRENRESESYIGDFYTEGIKLAALLSDAGDQEKSDELFSDLTYNLSESGKFGSAIEKSLIKEDQLYGIFALSARHAGNSNGSALKPLTGKGSYEFTIVKGETERVSTEHMLDMAAKDEDRLRGMSVAAMYARSLAQGLVDKPKFDDQIENERLIRKALGVFGFDESQIAKIYEASSQSRSAEKHGYDIPDRIQKATTLFMQLREASGSEEVYKGNLQKLYKDYGIRNFDRYTLDSIWPQLQEGFVPDEVVITAFWDYSTAISKPDNSARGLDYKNPVYFEAENDLDLAKDLLRAHKLMNKPVSKILIRAHGGPDGFSLSETENGAIDTHKIEDRGANAWEHQIVEKGIVTKDAEVVFESCSLGAGGFPQSLYEKTGISALTSPKNIVGSSVVGAPGVIRVGGEVKFGTSPPDFNENKRDPSDLSDPVSIKR